MPREEAPAASGNRLEKVPHISAPGPAWVEAWGALGRKAHAYGLPEMAEVAYEAAVALRSADRIAQVALGEARVSWFCVVA